MLLLSISTHSPAIVNIELKSNTVYGKIEGFPYETVDHTYESLKNFENVGLKDNAPHDSEENDDTYI